MQAAPVERLLLFVHAAALHLGGTTALSGVVDEQGDAGVAEAGEVSPDVDAGPAVVDGDPQSLRVGRVGRDHGQPALGGRGHGGP